MLFFKIVAVAYDYSKTKRLKNRKKIDLHFKATNTQLSLIRLIYFSLRNLSCKLRGQRDVFFLFLLRFGRNVLILSDEIKNFLTLGNFDKLNLLGRGIFYLKIIILLKSTG